MEEVEEFQVEDVEQLVKQSLQSTITQETRYDPETANTLSKNILEACMKNLVGMQRPFKYVVTILIMQKNGAGMHTAMGALWDSRKDGTAKIPWENDTMHVIVTVYGKF
jgi:dynein light chain Tctex-type 1